MVLDMKKNIFFGMLLSLITFLFIFIPNVKAEETGFEFTYSASVYENEGFVNYTTTFNENTIYNNIKEYGVDIEGYKYIIIQNGDGNNIAIYLFNDLFTWNEFDSYSNKVSKSIMAAPKGINYTLIKYSYDNVVSDVYYYVSNGINSSSISPGIYEEGYFILRLATRNSKVYTNFDINYSYKYGSIENVLTKPSKPPSYEFNEDIVVTDISKIKVKFNLPEDTSNLYIDLKYKISQLGFGVGTLGDPFVSLKSIENDIEKTNIHTEKSYKNKDDIVEEMKKHINNYYDNIGAIHNGDENLELLIKDLNNIFKDDDYKEISIEAAIKNRFIENESLFDLLYPLALRYVNEDYCSGTYIVNLLPDSTVYEYTFEIDVYNYEGSINLNFISNLNYEIEYEYKTEINDYLTTINMKNYSALILIPKVKNLETGALTSIQSDIYLSGIYDIELWEDVESKNVLYRKSNYNYNVFSHYQNYNYLNAILYFIKKPVYDVDQYVTFDSRYYSYVVKTYLAEEVEIINPNTGVTISVSDISGLYDSDVSSIDFSLNEYLSDISDTANYFDYYFGKAWILLPFRIRAIILFIFNIICVSIIMRIGGYLK